MFGIKRNQGTNLHFRKLSDTYSNRKFYYYIYGKDLQYRWFEEIFKMYLEDDWIRDVRYKQEITRNNYLI